MDLYRDVADGFSQLLEKQMKLLEQSEKQLKAEGRGDELGYPALCLGIMAPWREKLNAARLHDDTVNAVIEENKLETGEKLLRMFQSKVRVEEHANG